MKKILLKNILILQLIWIIHFLKAGIVWHHNYSGELNYIAKYLLALFIFPSLTISIVIALLYKASDKFKNSFNLIIYIALSVWITLSLYYILEDGYRFLLWDKLNLSSQKTINYSMNGYVKAFSSFIFLFIILNLSSYMIAFWNKFRKQKIDLLKLSLTYKNKTESLSYDSKVFLSKSSIPNFIELSAIKYIEADSYIINIYTKNGKKISLSQQLKQWEEKLPEKQFKRVHKSIIVNLEYIEKVNKLSNQTYQVFLKGDNEPLQMSRRYGKIFVANSEIKMNYNLS